MKKLEEGKDYYIDEQTGYMVFTALYLSQRGVCCGNKCKECPYIPKWEKRNKNLEGKQ